MEKTRKKRALYAVRTYKLNIRLCENAFLALQALSINPPKTTKTAIIEGLILKELAALSLSPEPLQVAKNQTFLPLSPEPLSKETLSPEPLNLATQSKETLSPEPEPKEFLSPEPETLQEFNKVALLETLQELSKIAQKERKAMRWSKKVRECMEFAQSGKYAEVLQCLNALEPFAFWKQLIQTAIETANELQTPINLATQSKETLSPEPEPKEFLNPEPKGKGKAKAKASLSKAPLSLSKEMQIAVLETEMQILLNAQFSQNLSISVIGLLETAFKKSDYKEFRGLLKEVSPTRINQSHVKDIVRILDKIAPEPKAKKP